jgi:micrococcal nuclease
VFDRSVNRRRPARPLLLTTLLVAVLASAAPVAGRAETVRARAAPDGATLLLEDGREVRLAGLLVPPAGLRFPNAAAERIGQRAAEALAALAVGKPLELAVGAAHPDRYGRLEGELRDASGRLLQAILLAQGLARFDPGAAPPPDSGAMYTAERTARDHHRGLWAERVFAVRRPDDLQRSVDDFTIVSGVVARVERAGTRLLIRFGDPSRDATLTIDGAARARFKALAYDLAALVGTRIRARGWVERQGPPVGGMAIAIEQPVQIERLLGTGELYR